MSPWLKRVGERGRCVGGGGGTQGLYVWGEVGWGNTPSPAPAPPPRRDPALLPSVWGAPPP